jgi:hypothetical protein
MTNTQLYLAIGVPLIFNTIFNTVLVLFIWSSLNAKIDALDRSLNKRLDDMNVSWRDALLRVEQVIDARLKHLEERWEENKQ